jgi:hypothetical protein
MPMAKGIFGVQWANCDRCGFLRPINTLRRQLGLLLCSQTPCTDDLSNMYRPKIIQSVLAEPGEGTSETSELFKDPGETVEF